MSLSAVRLTLLLGPNLPLPAPAPLAEALDSVEVKHSDEGRSGFQVVFQAGRGGADRIDYPLLTHPLLEPLNRVILVVTFGVFPRVLMDGIVTNRQLTPGKEPGEAKVTLTGEDLSLLMDRQEKTAEHPAQHEGVIALKIIASYASHGIVPLVVPPPALDVPSPVERIPVQRGTDLQFLQEMALRSRYVFCLIPGPVPGTSTAYWGPPVRQGVPQPALSVNLGPHTNVEGLDFQNDALAAAAASGKVQDRTTNLTLPVPPLPSTVPPLSARPTDLLDPRRARKVLLSTAGLTAPQALARAQAANDASAREAVTATGELNALTYGTTLQARALVGLRGAGHSHDGLYYVKSVTHSIRRGEYKQRFTLAREGLGATTEVVRP